MGGRALLAAGGLSRAVQPALVVSALLRRSCSEGVLSLAAGLAACLLPATAFGASLRLEIEGAKAASLGGLLPGVAAGAALTAGEINWHAT